ncbi:helix-turn-helix transcriptional regulator [Arthrobacter sp. zg-Y895]|uniref:helix-turn-helix transcriptional regulator n=1 Tax=Arthrobacter sp. zg-Y895 TaxID=2886933 RepID=UPI001D15D7DD|nr:AAA family ATPase [Arthrobacter sp. zg-Y895]MCC3302922.1 LuxR C-terminal-related transcriptional regulator [Arthrobacter sp. zg-Y895]
MESVSLVAGLIGRTELLDDLCSALAAGGAGAVILGQPGAGKTAVLHAVADRLRADFHIIPVRGTAIAAGTPYGALAYLISGLPEGAEQDPLQLLQELSRSFDAEARESRVLVTVDNADRLDRFSIMVLSQLLRRGKIAVLAAASIDWEADHELVGLWSEGLLERVDLELLTERQTRQLMQELLGGPVSSLAAGTMWKETLGSPRLIRLMTGAQVRSGTLVRREAVWVRTAPFVRTGEVSEVFDTVLDRMGAHERRLVEVLALCVSLPLSSVLELVPATAVEALEEQQIISVGGNPPSVRLGGGNPGSVIAASMAPGRRRELWEDVGVRIDPTDMDGEELTGFLGWALSCGEEIRPADALRAARAANDRADAAAALRFVRAVAPKTPGQEMVLEEVRALHSVGHLDKVLRVFREAEPRLASEKRSSFVPLMLLYSYTLARVPGSGDPQEALAAVEESCPAEGESPELEAALVLARSALAADGGRLPLVPERLTSLAGDGKLGQATRMQAAALSAHVLALAGRTDEALHILDQLGPPENYAVNGGNAGEACTRIFDTYVLSGELDRAATFVEAFDATGVRPSYQGSAGELAVAVLAAWQGQEGMARDALTGAIGQLRVHDPQDMLPLARTLTAYIHRERRPEAAELLRQAAAGRQSPSYFRGFLLRYFSILSDGDDGIRCGRLRAEAASAHAAGYAAPALLFLSAAVRAGDRDAAADVIRVSKDVSGRFSERMADFAAGLLNDDPVRLVAAAKGFLDCGQYLLSRDAARAVEHSLAECSADERKRLARTAREVANASMRRMEHSGGRAETLAELSEFEADLAHRAVTMATTTQIARELNLSPRTIEWHLGKIFAKLHVSGRIELSEILA